MLKKIKEILLYEGPLTGSSKTVQPQIREENRRFAVIWSAAQLLYWSYCLIMSTKYPDFLMCRRIYIMAFAACAAVLLLAVFAAPKLSWLVGPISVMLDIALLGAGLAIAHNLAPKTIVIFISVILVPVFFISSLWSTLCLLLGNILVFAIFGRIGMDPEAFRWTLVNLMIFSSIGIILGYFVNKTRFERYYFAESKAKLADLQTRYAYFDQMTGLQNRRAYAEQFDRLAEEMPNGCIVIMADINGLKEMNDSRGHDAGDELIIGTAECLRKSFETDSIFRIGGDEFCVILFGAPEDAEKCLKQLQENAGNWRGEYVKGISVSYGLASDREFADIVSMAKAADQRMYKSKREYYEKSGKDRRRR